MSRQIFEVLVKLLGAALVLGFGFALAGFNPWHYLGPLGGLSAEATRWGIVGFQWVWTHVVLGIAVVVPAWIVYVIVHYFRRRR